ncbi:hypothetical protein PLICRDRAFT_103901 [Plicaturopsis crispa FD-325 SS-3]|nr:hypothetical protein PLICRDRAFT_103901 [Plicaturopsis crispa FD-325 SS-3]
MSGQSNRTPESPRSLDPYRVQIDTTNHQNPSEVIAALTVLRNFLADAPALIPPQIFVKGNGRRRVYGRLTLKSMSYEEVTRLFTDRFSIEDDWVTAPTPFMTRWAPSVSMYATFCRTYPGGTGHGPVLLDESGWPELVDNIEKIRVVFIPKSIHLPLNMPHNPI